jgi:type I restriction enzyme S subunit
MTEAWPMMPLGEVLTERQEVPTAEALANGDIRIVAKITFNDGKIQLRSGCETKTGMILVCPGDLLISGINAAKGAIAIYGEENTEPIAATIHYGAYVPNKDRVNVKYLWWLLRSGTFRDLLYKYVPGGIKTELKAKRLLPIPVPLPSIEEQRRIVAKIDELTAKMDEVQVLKEYTFIETKNFWKVLSRIARGTVYSTKTIAEMVEFLDGQRIPLSSAQRTDREGEYPYYGASGIIDWVDDYIFDETLLLLSEDGANLINRSTPIAFIATGKYWVNNHAHVLRPRPEIADIKFLEYALSDYNVSVFNFASAQPKLNQKNAAKIAFPVPPLDAQRRIVAYLDGLKSKAEELENLQGQIATGLDSLMPQAETADELDAILPSILDKAFKGEL